MVFLSLKIILFNTSCGAGSPNPAQNVIGDLKKFRILSNTYRCRRKRFTLRFNLIAGIYNFELGL